MSYLESLKLNLKVQRSKLEISKLVGNEVSLVSSSTLIPWGYIKWENE